MRSLLPALLFSTACSAPAPAPDPFAVIATEYAVPVAWGLANPGSVGGWNDSVTLRSWAQGWTHRPAPHDVDNTFVNYVLHPLSGSETHLLARRAGWSFAEAALFDAAASLAWEGLYENVFERPSRVDLVVTAPAGALLGELRWQLRQAGAPRWLVDPLDGHGEPFVQIEEDGLIFGLQRRF
jgi:hypothetical protein